MRKLQDLVNFGLKIQAIMWVYLLITYWFIYNGYNENIVIPFALAGCIMTIYCSIKTGLLKVWSTKKV